MQKPNFLDVKVNIKSFIFAESTKITGIKYFTILVIYFCIIAPAVGQTWTSISDGNWSDDIWSKDGGLTNCTCSPPSSFPAGDTVLIYHNINYNRINDLFVNKGAFKVLGGSFYAEELSFTLENGLFEVYEGAFTIAIYNQGGGLGGGSFKNEGGSAVIFNSAVEIAQDWASIAGTNSFSYGCLSTGQNYSNDTAIDMFDAVCITIGIHGSGNYSINGEVNYYNGTSIFAEGSSGSFNLAGSGTMNGDMGVIHFLNGGINTNSGAAGTVSLVNYCAGDGLNDQANTFQGETSNCGASNCLCEFSVDPLICTLTLVKDVSCNGGSDGQAEASASGGIFFQPYEFDWGGHDPDNLSAGPYIVTVTDYVNSTSTCSIVIDQPASLSCSTNVIQNVSCFGGNDGIAEVTASGGTGPYEFDWGCADPGNMFAGTYWVTVTDFNGCESICSVFLTEPSTPVCTDDPTTILIPSGSLIIDMGVSPQTWENGIKPYGMIFDLIKNRRIPIIWSINSNKQSNKNIGVEDIDFSYNGQDFKGGPFIIMAQYRTGNVNATITQWENKGVVTIETTADITVPYFKILRNVPNWTLDFANGSKLIPGFNQAEIPEFNDPLETDVNYIFKTPDQLTCCDYVFAMPHADPVWSTHGNLNNWVKSEAECGCRGWIYSACHAVSAIENTFDDQTPDVGTQMNFLSNKTADADISMSPWAENSLVIWGDHGDGDGNYIYDTNESASPFMQFIGTMGNAMESGSEQIYMPYLTSSWRNTTRIPIYDSDHPDIGGIATGRAAKLAYGPAFGNGSYDDYTKGNGWTMYMGGHEITGSEESEVSAYRSFFNFSFMAALSRGGDITYFDTIPSQIERNKTIPVSASASGGSPDYTFTWEVDPPIGSFSVNSITAGEGVVVNTQYTAPHVTAPVQVVISLTISDQCITRTIQSYATIIVPDPLSCTVTATQHVSCNGDNDGRATVQSNGGTNPITFDWGGINRNQLSAGTYVVTVNDFFGSSTCSVTITEPDPLSCTITSVQDAFCNQSDGQASISVTGGTSPYTIDWGSADPNALAAGSYTATVTDDNGCTTSCSVTISEYCCYDITGLWIYDQVTDARVSGIPMLTEGASVDISLLPTNYYLVAETATTDFSVELTLDSNTPICENITPYTYPGGAQSDPDGGWNGGIGCYTLTAKAYSDSGCTGSLCETITVNFCIEEDCQNFDVTLGPDLTVCEGETLTLAPQITGSTLCGCCIRIVDNTTDCQSAQSYMMTLDGIEYTGNGDLDWEECGDGSARLTGTATNGANTAFIDISYSGYSNTPPSGSPVSNNCVAEDATNWVYYTNISSGTINIGATNYTISRRGPSFQIGLDANMNQSGYGGYGLFYADDGSATLNGGIYLDLSESCASSAGCSEETISGMSYLGTYGNSHYYISTGGDLQYWDAYNYVDTRGGHLPKIESQGENDWLSSQIGSSIWLGLSDDVQEGNWVWYDNSSLFFSHWSSGEPSNNFGEDFARMKPDGFWTDRESSQWYTVIMEKECSSGGSGGILEEVSYLWTPGNYTTPTIEITPTVSTSYTLQVTGCDGCIDLDFINIIVDGDIVCPPDLTLNCDDSLDPDLTGYPVFDCDTSAIITYVDAVSGTCPVTTTRTWTASVTRTTEDPCIPIVLAEWDFSNANARCSIGQEPLSGVGLAPSNTNNSYCNNPVVSNMTMIDNTNGSHCVKGLYNEYKSALALEVDYRTTFTADDDDAARFSMSYGSNDEGKLTSISLYEKVSAYDENFECVDYALKFGIRILKNSVEIYRNVDIPTTVNGWGQHSFDLTGVAEMEFSGATTFDFEILGYKLNDNEHNYWMWQIDELQVTGCCGTEVSTEVQEFTCQQTLTLVDNESPTITNVPIDTIVQCASDVPPVSTSVVLSDNCIFDASFSADTSTVSSCNEFTITRTWTAVDSCGNSTTASQLITVQDTIPPIASAPADIIIECYYDLPPPDPSVVLDESDNCGLAVQVLWNNDNPSIIPCNATEDTIVRAYQLLDCVGNSSLVYQNIVIDNNLPVINCPADQTIEFIADFVAGTPSVTVSCAVTYSLSESGPILVSGDNCTGAVYHYVYTVTDECGRSSSCTQSITTLPSALTCSLSLSSNGCNQDNMSLSGTISNGYGAVSYLWNTGATTSSISNISNGTYILTVTDSYACTSTSSIVVNEPDHVSCSISVINNVTCNGQSDGRASVLGIGGTSPYAYNWGGEDENALAAGTYVVTVTDANGCTNTCDVTITEPAVLTCSTTLISNVSCNGFSDGQASVLGIGGTSPYNYNWGGEDENALAAGTYVVTVTDANGCTNTCDVTIIEPAVLTCSTTVISNVSCNGLSDGSASVLGSGGTSPYTYNWGGEDENALAAGTYVVTVTDANGCTNTCDLTITEPAVLTCSTTVINNVSCNGLSDGRASVLGNGGTSPYTYNWGAANENALAAGTYVVTVTDVNACTNTCDVTITEPAVLTCSTTVISNVSCNGLSDGRASVLGSGGTSPYTYNWGGEDENALAAGTYVVTVTDANGCTNTCDVTITEPAVLTCSTTVINNVSCNGLSDGSASVLGSDGTSPYSYNWGGEDENALAAGTYVVTVTDANGCTNTCDVTITEPAVLTCSTTVVSHVSCNGLSDGQASVLGSGGTSPYSYNWGGEDENALAAGTYVVTVTDANGCTNTCDVTITEPAVLSCSTTVISHVSCNGLSDGQASVLGSGGTSPYSYNWGGEDENALTASTYVVTVTDANGCTNTCDVMITEPALLTCSTTVVSHVSCNGISDGQASVLGSGGTSPYTYNWGGEDENALAAGTYVVTVTDANGCTNTCDVVITEPDALACSTAAMQNVSCNGMSDGQAAVVSFGGTAPYSYDWGGEDENALAAGTYVVTVTDANGCTNTCDVTITEPAVLTCSTTVISNVSCNALSDGQASVLGSGGTSPYTYNWGGEDENALAAGSYVVTVTDANGCTNTCDVVITEPDALACSTAAMQNVSCNGMSDGQAAVVSFGGTAPYSYDWGGEDENALAAGTYVVTVTDANGCTNTCDVIITEPAVLTCSTTVINNVSCNSLSDGRASVLGSGGTSPYTYNWGGADENALAAGSYVVTVTDANGCTNTCDVTITEPAVLTCSTTVINNVSCNGLSDGSASVLGIGGTSPYTYNWGGADENALAAGSYVVMVTDANGCANTCDVTITEPTGLICSTTVISNVSCNGLSDGRASVLGIGGTSPYTYDWGGEDENALAAGSYVVTVTDANGCTNTCDIIITEPAVLTCSTTVISNVSCNGLSDGRASVLGIGGTSPYSYNWGGEDENALAAGSYVVTVTDANGCTNTCDVTITEPAVLTCSTTVISNVTCNGLTDGQASVLGIGGTSPYTYNWGGEDENALAAGSYVVTVTDANGCTNTCDVTITEPDILNCSTTVINNVGCNSLSDGRASVLGSGGTSPYTYNWGGADENALAAGSYVVTVTDANGCTNTCDVIITEPAVLTCSTTVINNVSCNGLSDGSASVLGIGGTSPYTYNWGGADENALAAGSYVVTVTDANGCTNTCDVIITEPAVLTCSTIVISNVSCNGLGDGSASVLGIGGTSPYTYNWGGADENALAAGSYVVTVTDANGCTNTCDVTITEPAVLTCSTTVINNVSCNGLSDGSASVLGIGGTSPYTYNWGGADENAMAAGSYVVTVTDANDCTNTCDVTITEPTVLTCSTTVINNVSCNGLSDGQANVLGSGGTSPYTYNWGGVDENALAAGSYVVTVTDANGCTNTCDVTITEPDILNCSTTVISNVSCNGLSDGSASVLGSGGTSPYSYNWGGEDENALSAGTYVVTVTDANGCTNTCDVEITEPVVLSCSTTVINNVSCNGLSDGRASVLGNGGTSPYSYDWGGEDENALPAGTYGVTVTDANGCTNTCDVEITEPVVLSCSTTVINNVSCNGLSDGQANVLASGGTSPYTYNWGGANENALAAGSYVVTVTDANGCTNTCDVIITEPAVLTCSTTVINNVSCNSLSDGRASVLGIGGTSPYTYNWGGADENALAAGSYVVTVTDANDCTNTCDVTITEPTVLTCSTTVINNVSCNGLSDGQANVLGSGGTSPYTYNWGGVDENALAAGSYVVTVTDANGCTNTCDVTITEPDILNCSTTVINNVSCNGLSDGQASVLASGGTSPYSYNWGSEDENALAAGSYVMTVTDANGCTNTCDVVITEPAVLSCSTTVINNVSCNGLSDGSASVLGIGGTSPYTYNWGGEDENALAAGSYVVTVTDANGCTNTCDVTITEPTVLTCSTTVISNVSCNGLSDGSASVLGNGGTSPYTYNWGGEDENALAAGTYVVTVTDANGCTNTCDVTITEPAVLTCSTTVISNVSCNGLSDGRASVLGIGGTSPYTYNWGGEDENALAAGSYVVTVTDANGCTNTCDVTITEPAVLTCSTTVISNVSCNGLSDGQASVSASGGQAPYIYDWGNANPLALAAGDYVITVTDLQGCTNTCEVTITEPDALSCSASVIQNVSCYGANDGQASVNASGGTAPYTYDWGGADSNALSAGTYYITIVDQQGCSNVCSVVITEPAQVLSCEITLIQNITCSGCSDGQASVSATGGTAPYIYDWGGANPNALPAGTFIVTVTDSNSCTSTCSVNLYSPDELVCDIEVAIELDCEQGTAQVTPNVTGGDPPYSYDWGGADPDNLTEGIYNLVVTDFTGNMCSHSFSIDPPVLICELQASNQITCTGGSDGSLTVSMIGGSNDMTYEWSNGFNGQSQTGLSAGTYTVTVTDNTTSCDTEASYVLNDPVPMFCSAFSVPTSCGNNNGVAGVSVSNGSGTYAYMWNSGQETATISNLAPGTYSVTVTDQNTLCTTVCSTTIGASAGLTCSITQEHTSCGLNNGSAQAEISGGSGNYTYNWSNGSSTSTISDLGPGVYNLIVTDNITGCLSSCSVSIFASTELSCNLNSINTTCGLSNGSISAFVSGGSGDFSFSWSNGSTGSSIEDLNSGSYTLTVVDNISFCTAECSSLIEDSEPLGSIMNIDQTSCGLSNGSISLSVSGGTGSYSYSWSNGATSETLSALASGVYSVTITDEITTCSSEAFGVIENSDALTCTINSTPTSCGLSNGTASVTISGGSGNYAYNWSNGSLTQYISALASGNYELTVTDLVTGCTSICNTVVAYSNNITCNLISNDASCGLSNGSIIANVFGGSADYSFSWSNGSTNAFISGLASANYSVTVVDNLTSCSTIANINLGTTQAVSCTITGTNTSCDLSNGTASAIA